MISFRNLLVHYYERIDDTIVFGVFKRHLVDFDHFIETITAFLQQQSASPNGADQMNIRLTEPTDT
jgi:uncharacterized protein YutE (UPF0331/DUF86 family)